MMQILAIALGGAAGAVTRFLVANAIYGWLGRGFPAATLFINVSGSLLMGLLGALFASRLALAVELRAALLIGFLGAYTTFSTFALETLFLYEEGQMLKATLNVALSVVGCLAAVWTGMALGRWLFAGGGGPWPAGLAWPPLLAATLIILLAAAMQYLAQHLQAAAAWRLPVQVLLLAAAAAALTLWLAHAFGAGQPLPPQLAGLFLAAGCAAALLLWLGMYLGNWIWQLHPSR